MNEKNFVFDVNEGAFQEDTEIAHAVAERLRTRWKTGWPAEAIRFGLLSPDGRDRALLARAINIHGSAVVAVAMGEYS